MPDPPDELKRRAAAARQKAAPLGPDIDLSDFSESPAKTNRISSIGELGQEDRDRIRQVGIVGETERRSAGFIQIDKSVAYSESFDDGVEIMAMAEALKAYPWLDQYYWGTVSVDADKYTAAVGLDPGGGYFIRALRGKAVKLPVQSCLYIETEKSSQRVHNIVIVEEDAELHVITGCTNRADVRRALHLGISEFYVKKGGRLSFTMIHNWDRELSVRPRSAAVVEGGGVMISNYVCLEPAGSLQMYPSIRLGPDSVARLYSLLLASPGCEMDVGGRVELGGAGARAEVVSRAVSTGGSIIARGSLVGSAPGVRGHLECSGLILSEAGRIHAVPELEGELSEVDLSHEAAVGRISQEEIEYLMARGLSEEEATSTIVRGFLDVKIQGLPEGLSDYIKRIVDRSGERASM